MGPASPARPLLLKPGRRGLPGSRKAARCAPMSFVKRCLWSFSFDLPIRSATPGCELSNTSPGNAPSDFNPTSTKHLTTVVLITELRYVDFRPTKTVSKKNSTATSAWYTVRVIPEPAPEISRSPAITGTTHERILRVGKTLFANRGYEHTSTSAIA